MKKRKLKLLSLLMLLGFLNAVNSQTLSMSPNPEDNAVCPGIIITYTISNYNSSCHSISVINGTVVQDNDDGTLKVNWFDNGAKGSITITRNATGCSGVAGTRTFDVPIKTLAFSTPTITASKVPAAGFQEVVTYTASLNWPFRGNNDPNPFPVTSFTWTLPAGWTNNTLPATSASINVTTNIGGGGTITAVGNTNCGSGATNSIAGNLAVTRTLSVPCPLNAQSLTVLCGEPGTNAFFASSQPAGYSANNPQWSWSLPQGWTVNGPTNTQFLNVNTDGQHGGPVKVTFSDYGVSASCSKNIELVVANPGTIATGLDRLCQTETYSLTSLPIAQGATSSWAISPATAPVAPMSGQGTSATISPVSGTLNGAGSAATITFTVSGCGVTSTFSKDIFVGKPEIYGHTIDGTQTTSKNVCPGWHILTGQVRGDDSNPPCLTWELVNNQGSPPHSLYVGGCNWAQVYLNPLNSAPAFVRVTADNECGSTVSYYYLYPVLTNCKENYNFLIYPNPASNVLNLEVKYDDGQSEAIALAIGHAQLVNTMGVTILDMPNTDSDAIEMNLASVPNGLYVVRAQVGNQWLTKNVQVSKN